MKTVFAITATMLSQLVWGQGNFLYDQESANENLFTGSWLTMQTNQPLGQSFTPSLPAVGFVRLQFTDFDPGNSLGGTVYVNLRSESITGTILGTTAPVFMSDGYGFGSAGYADFFFLTPVAVTPGVMYYFQPVLDSGDAAWAVGRYHFSYLGGTEYIQGVANPFDFWFREGIVVPEPSGGLLVLVSSGVMVLLLRKKCVGR